MKEEDWKVLPELRSIALERFCEAVLSEINRACSEVGASAHDRYLAVFRLIEQRDRELAIAFNDPRRSTALMSLLQIRSLGLLTAGERDRFSPELREWLRSWPMRDGNDP